MGAVNAAPICINSNTDVERYLNIWSVKRSTLNRGDSKMVMSKTGRSGLKLNIQTHKSFDETHLEVAKKLRESGLHPDRYDDDTFGEYQETIIIESTKIIRDADGTQGEFRSRVAGRSDKQPTLDNDIYGNGFKLKHLPIPVRLMPDGTYRLLDGRSRDGILSRYDVTNRVVDVFICTDQQADDFGIRANLDNPISAPAKKIDVIANCNRSIKRGTLKPKNGGWTLDDVPTLSHHVESLAADGALTKTTRQEIALAVLNQNMTDIEVRSWTTPEVHDWLLKNKYINTAEVKYMVLACNQPTRALGLAASKYCNFTDTENIEVRVIIHTGLLDGFDLERNYDTRINSFRNAWENQLSAVSDAFFFSKIPSKVRVKLWGAAPSISTIHNMDKIIKFGKRPTVVDDIEEDDYEEAA